MEFLYLSRLASQEALNEAINRDPTFISYAVQKFNRLVVEGIVKNGHSVTALSTFYQPKVGFFYLRHSENVEGISYHYVASPNYHLFRDVWLVVYCFFYVFFWGVKNKKDRVFVADVLNISACIGALAAARLIGLKRVGIMTDMPGLMVSRKKGVTNNNTLKSSFFAGMNKSFLSKFTHYVFLTEQMNSAVNTNNRPYLVMEGLVDSSIVSDCRSASKEKEKIVIYAGGLHERYGIKLLVEGFIKADVQDSELWLFGDGPFVGDLKRYMETNSKIKYCGIKPNAEIVEAEKRATLLVNPRPTHEKFTEYSFPSKNMEYMVSGTPVLTTILPGMPVEYHQYVYLFDKGETVDGYASVLNRVLSLPFEQLQEKGKEARQWVLRNKNNYLQAKRIIDLLGK